MLLKEAFSFKENRATATLFKSDPKTTEAFQTTNTLEVNTVCCDRDVDIPSDSKILSKTVS